jgi:hypothetical protein
MAGCVRQTRHGKPTRTTRSPGHGDLAERDGRNADGGRRGRRRTRRWRGLVAGHAEGDDDEREDARETREERCGVPASQAKARRRGVMNIGHEIALPFGLGAARVSPGLTS